MRRSEICLESTPADIQAVSLACKLEKTELLTSLMAPMEAPGISLYYQGLSSWEIAAEKKKKGREGSTHIAMDIRHCSKEELDAINERARAWKVQQAKQIAHQPASPKPPEQLELPITEEQTH